MLYNFSTNLYIVFRF